MCLRDRDRGGDTNKETCRGLEGGTEGLDRGDGTERGREGQRCGIVLREEGCERMGNERGRGGWQVEGVGGGVQRKGEEREGEGREREKKAVGERYLGSRSQQSVQSRWKQSHTEEKDEESEWEVWLEKWGTILKGFLGHPICVCRSVFVPFVLLSLG